MRKLFVATVINILFGLFVCGKLSYPVPCRSPTQWEAQVYMQNVMMRYTEWRNLSYDAVNQREFRSAEVDVAAEHDHIDTLILWKERKMYEVNRLFQECTITNLTGVFRPRGVPMSNTTYEEGYAIGGQGIPGEYMTVYNFYTELPDGYLTSLVSHPSCFPIWDYHYTTDQGIQHTIYQGVTVGISDPSVFDIPQLCLK
ncbi:mammalian ependymin-related protein 1-like [Argopecten irradians]|uniref:mammalian ependymin-related protein 1-like n=1 Tax=Argopecten irradians TaxID=31199 RepID=UPI00371FA567